MFRRALFVYSLRPLRILVADDNRDTVLSLRLLLQEKGHDVMGAYNGFDALRVARLHAFDAMILDIEMPELSAYALARELRALLKLVSAHRLAILGAR